MSSAARVNLLPHREERRKLARQHFYVLAGGTALVGIVIVIVMHTFYAARIEFQADRNKYLKSEVAKLDKEIAEINKLKDEIQALLARKQVIETLQADRAQNRAPPRSAGEAGARGRVSEVDHAERPAHQAAGLRAIERARLDSHAEYRGFALAGAARAVEVKANTWTSGASRTST